MLFQGLEYRRTRITGSRYHSGVHVPLNSMATTDLAPQFNQGAAEEGIELADSAIVAMVSQGRYLIRSAVLFGFWFDWRAVKQAIQCSVG